MKHSSDLKGKEMKGGHNIISSTQAMNMRHGGHGQEVLSESIQLGRHFSWCGEIERPSGQIID